MSEVEEDLPLDISVAAAFYFYCNAAYRYQLYLLKYSRKRLKTRQARRWWMLAMHKKRTKESMEKQFQEMLVEPSKEFHNFCRMSFTDFEILLQKLDPIISKKDTKWRDCIPSKVRLAITLRYLASGDSYASLHYLFKISSQSISKIVREVCTALWEVLKDHIKIPITEKEWLAVECGYNNHFPHAIGAIDAKHIVLQSPIVSDLKKSFNSALLTLVDSNCCFMFADVVSQPITNDSVPNKSVLWNAIEKKLTSLPKPTPLPDTTEGAIDLPYVFLSDDTFDLNKNVMTPYPGDYEEGTLENVFNKKISSARIFVENTFGAMYSVFRVLRKPILLELEPAIQVVKACTVLHNFLKTSEHSSSLYSPTGTFDMFEDNILTKEGFWRQDIPDKPALCNIQLIATESEDSVIEIRNKFAEYFNQ